VGTRKNRHHSHGARMSPTRPPSEPHDYPSEVVKKPQPHKPERGDLLMSFSLSRMVILKQHGLTSSSLEFSKTFFHRIIKRPEVEYAPEMRWKSMSQRFLLAHKKSSMARRRKPTNRHGMLNDFGSSGYWVSVRLEEARCAR